MRIEKPRIRIKMLKGSPRLNLLFHPNINGHEAWAQSLLLWSRGEMALPVEKLSFEERVKAKVSWLFII